MRITLIFCSQHHTQALLFKMETAFAFKSYLNAERLESFSDIKRKRNKWLSNKLSIKQFKIEGSLSCLCLLLFCLQLYLDETSFPWGCQLNLCFTNMLLHIYFDLRQNLLLMLKFSLHLHYKFINSVSCCSKHSLSIKSCGSQVHFSPWLTAYTEYFNCKLYNI